MGHREIMKQQTLFCTFSIGPLYMGIEVDRVQEVSQTQALTRIPGASSDVRGLMNLRGQIVTALDMRRRLNLPAADAAAKLMNVVVRTPDGPVNLLVDEIGDVLVFDRDQFEPPPETLQGVSRELISGSYKLEGCLLLVLNLDMALSLSA